MVLGWGLTRRLDAAYRMTQGLLLAGIAASLLKGLDWEEALVLTVVSLLLLPARPHFYRRSALTAEPLSPNWIVAIVAMVGFTAWLGFFSYKHVDYSSDLWWRFTLHGDAPRSLRAMVGVMAPLATFAFARLFRHAPVRPSLPTVAQLQAVSAIVNESTFTSANLALLGDKSLLMSESGKGFLMYGIAGRSWVAMGDPVGAPAEQRELVWAFRELVDRHGGWTVFYEVSGDRLPLYVELGLTLLKVGEEAIVSLAEFSLEGGHRRGLRRSHRVVMASGAQFAVEPAARVSGLMAELSVVSDEWLAAKQSREMGFSLGRFEPAYLARFPMAVVRIEGRLVAFANLWCAPANGELSVDLMRYANAAPEGVMTYLFLELMLWGRANGYRTFNLGMAPLSGIESRALAPLWTRAAAYFSQHGESLYHFQGLRQFKEKFGPEWRPRYLASPAGLALPRILANVASLVSGGLAGAVRK
jgi:phosphatidylglycerol lysyltransferase